MRRNILGRPRKAKLPSERDWERSAIIEPRLAPRYPELVSDGASLAFPPTALLAPGGGLEPEDLAAQALVALLLTERVTDPFDEWRILMRTEDEVLFGRGLPPELVTVAARRHRRGEWTAAASSVDTPLVAVRDGIRASAWRLDPTQVLQGDERTLRVLVHERTFASGQTATRRILPPDIHIGEGEIIIRAYVKPRPGFQTGTPNPETPVRFALPEAVGTRPLIDGAKAPHLPG
jgi:hypothetical protein